jgi:hypothetical protein
VLAPSRKQRNHANTLHTPTAFSKATTDPPSEWPYKPFMLVRTRDAQSASEGPSKSSLSDETIESLFYSDTLFPTLLDPSAYILKLASFEPETSMVPQSLNKATSTRKNETVTIHPPPIPKPEFLAHRFLHPKLMNPTATSLLNIPQPHIFPVQTTTSSSQNPILSVTAPTMLMTNKGMAAMPRPRSNKVPLFDNEMSKFLDFFDIFKDLANSCALTDEKKCKIIVCYMDILTKCFWVTITSYESKDYTLFKMNILAKYP